MDSSIFTNSRPLQREARKTATVEIVDRVAAAKRGEKKTKPRKMTTITAHATARYVPDDVGKSNSLRRYFPVEQESTAEETRSTEKKSSKAKRNKNDKSSKTAAAPEHMVLSPEAAFKRFDDQDLLFGTWSQLERDESPTLVRETQMALHASESIMTADKEPFPSQGGVSASSTSSTVSRFTSSRNLWSVAARDSDGSLVQAEVLDMVDSPDLRDSLSNVSQSAPKQVDEEKKKERQEYVWVEIDDTPKSHSKNAKGSSQRSSFPPTRETPSPSTQSVDQADHQPAQSGGGSTIPPEMPRYNGFTDAELAKQIAAYGFKPVKGRDKMIELLQKCWESKHLRAGKHTGSTTTGSRPQSSASSKSIHQPDITENRAEAVKPSKQPTQKSRTKSQSKTGSHLVDEKNQSLRKQRGGGRKKSALKQHTDEKAKSGKQPEHSSSRFHHVEEIEDSEDELIPSPSRLQQNRYSSRSTTPLPLTLSEAPRPTTSSTTSSKVQESISISTRTSSADSATANFLPDLATQITKAIRAQPRMQSVNGRKRPTWHEKILMYDPIVLEDLAAWLNTEGLGLVGEDREVSAGFVRQWCESRGICCCWKKNDR